MSDPLDPRVTRRRFLATASVTAASVSIALAAAPRWGLGQPTSGPAILRLPRGLRAAGEPDPHALAARALDAARQAGAQYADVRLTRGCTQSISGAIALSESETRAVGVRALVNGYWGFFSSDEWTPDEVVRLAQGAVAQARAHSRGQQREISLVPVTPVPAGSRWTMPVKYDPFAIPVDEKTDFIAAVHDAVRSHTSGVDPDSYMSFDRDVKVFASTDGGSWEQTTFRTAGSFGVRYPADPARALPVGRANVNMLSAAGRGWEHICDAPLLDAIPVLIEDAEKSRYIVPYDIGRYDVVFSGQAMASLLDATLGTATELDRALGYEANASGTSYLSDPLTMLGRERVAAATVTVSANRSQPGGLSTVRWDDDGVMPQDFTLVRDGILTDFQTTREQAAWLEPYYTRIGRPVRSNGCATSMTASEIAMQHCPNLVLHPGRDAVRFEDLVADTQNGIAVLYASVDMDQQVRNGVVNGEMREIKNGKLGKVLRGGALRFTTPELWKRVVALGGPGSGGTWAQYRGKGHPGQWTAHSVTAVPAKVTGLALINLVGRL